MDAPKFSKTPREDLAAMVSGSGLTSFEMWKIVENGLLSWKRYAPDTITACMVSDMRRLVKITGMWPYEGRYIPLAEWIRLYEGNK